MRLPSNRSLRFTQRWIILTLPLMLMLGGCTAQSVQFAVPTPVSLAESSIEVPDAESPTVSADDSSEFFGPEPPMVGPDRLGGGGDIRSLQDLNDAAACLADGQPAYALTLRSIDVYDGPSEESCKLARIQAGSVVRVEGLYQQEMDTPLTSLNRLLSPSVESGIGFEEDIRPLFESTCSACHGPGLQNAELMVTEYEELMEGSKRGPVIEPGDPAGSLLWRQIDSGIMPLVGVLTDSQKQLIYDWIEQGAAPARIDLEDESVWARVRAADYTPVANQCESSSEANEGLALIPSDALQIASCAAAPSAEEIAQLRPARTAPVSSGAASNGATNGSAGQSVGVEAAAQPPRSVASTGQSGISAAPLGLPAPTELDPWMVPQGGFCMEQRLQRRLEDQRGITALTFAPDGRLFLALDSPVSGEFDPNILFDAFHPSRSVAVYASVTDDSFQELLRESSRVTDMVWNGGSLYLNRAGEVGRIPDGGTYQTLANGFAVNGRLFHANNGIAISNGWLYVSAGGVVDGYSDGVINPGDGDVPAETASVNIAGGGNRLAARLVRAPLGRLVAERGANLFQTAARGLRNPYGLTTDPSGRLWFTDNGATNIAGEFSAGDEVNLFDPRTLSAAAAAGDESATPYYGFPMALAGVDQPRWSDPVLPLPNTAAPTGITWAYGTIFFAQYGRDPGLYRLANAGGRITAERILLGWPIQGLDTAPDGAIWVGMGNGGLYRLVPGC